MQERNTVDEQGDKSGGGDAISSVYCVVPRFLIIEAFYLSLFLPYAQGDQA